MLSDIKYNGVVRKEEIVWQKRNAQFLAYSMAKMGRPKSDDPMNYRFTIRFSNAEQKQLEAYAEKYNLTKGQVLKKGLELLYRQDKHS